MKSNMPPPPPPNVLYPLAAMVRVELGPPPPKKKKHIRRLFCTFSMDTATPKTRHWAGGG